MQVLYCKFSRQISVKFSAEYRTPDFPWNVKYTLHFQIFQIFRRFSNFSADFPQLYRIRRFSRFSRLRKFSADFPRQVFQIFRFTGSARFSADFSACQIFRQSASKSSFPDFPPDFPCAEFSKFSSGIFHTSSTRFSAKKKGLEIFQSCPITLDIL